MIDTIESGSIPEDLPYIKRNLGDTVVFSLGLIPFPHLALVLGWSPWIADNKFRLDGTEIHWFRDDIGVVGDTESNRVDGFQE